MEHVIYLALLAAIGGAVGVLWKRQVERDKEYDEREKSHRVEYALLTGKHTECQVENARISAEVAGLRREMDWVRKDSGTISGEASATAAWIEADFDGKILDYGGRLSDMLGYQKTELIGQNIEVLIADIGNVRDRHHAGLAAVKLTQTIRDKAVTGKAIHASGHMIDVVVSLSIAEHRGGGKVVKAILFELSPQMAPGYDRRRRES